MGKRPWFNKLTTIWTTQSHTCVKYIYRKALYIVLQNIKNIYFWAEREDWLILFSIFVIFYISKTFTNLL